MAAKKSIVALVGPNFFSYIQAIRQQLETLGYRAFFFDERHSNSVLSKIAYRLRLKSFINRKREEHLAGILQQILANGVTDVYLIAPEVIDRTFVDKLKNANIKVHLYIWDSAKNKPGFLDFIDLADSRASFEPDDCAKYNMKYIPLFAEDVFSQKLAVKSTQRSDYLVFSGTLHSQRVRLLLKLRRLLGSTNFRLAELTFYHSRLLFLIKSTLNLEGAGLLFSFQTVGFNKAEIAKAFLSSKGVIDIHHPGQLGLTSRTFETLRSGARLITLNKTALQLPGELQERIIVLPKIDGVIDRLPEIEKELAPLSEEMDYFLSLSRFSKELEQLAILL